MTYETPQGLCVYGTAYQPRTTGHISLADLAALAREAEKSGFDGLLTFYDHHNHDPWTMAAAMLQHTERLAPLVAVQPYAAPPFTTAKAIHSLSSLYGRRLDLNLIVGSSPTELSQVGDTTPHDARYERAAEYMDVVSHLLRSDEPLDHDGTHYHYRQLQVFSRTAEALLPRVFVAGSSEASRSVALKVGDVSVTHPEPVSDFAVEFARWHDKGLELGVRFGLLARTTDAEAWEAARAAYPVGRAAHIETVFKRRSESEWSRRLAHLATDGDLYDEVYWTGLYRSGKAAAPLLVGSYERVAEYLERYLSLGIRTLLLSQVHTREDFRHASRVLSLLRTTRTRT
ncbi:MULTISPECIES: LLM class flavin-dependent oxidoreductase [unclassified Streptomyces]|uniref:LLM class flavin-dependent oxidoreductase n=1 Tax=unclassified Streptomyces TaxID=2593676 RepID=UPI00278C1A7C|nr:MULTISPECIES: LLM class flavin-dependent oxidoreductase [unclassified Streptomyces]